MKLRATLTTGDIDDSAICRLDPAKDVKITIEEEEGDLVLVLTRKNSTAFQNPFLATLMVESIDLEILEWK